MTNETNTKQGITERRGGRQMGDGRSVLQHRDKAEWDEAPEISGDTRESESDLSGDASSQHFGGDNRTPDRNAPSTPAAIPVGVQPGESGGEREFKERQDKS
jgi:hypothetical protein